MDLNIESSRRPTVTLVGRDGNAFSVMGAARKAARKAGWSKEEIAKYTTEAMSGDYDNLLAVTVKYFNVI